MTRTITRRAEIAAPIEKVFDCLLTPSQIARWWGVSSAIVLREEGGVYALAWGDDEDDPDYITIGTIRGFHPPHGFDLVDYKYRSRQESPAFVADLWVRFELSSTESGTMLTVHNFGFPVGEHADEFHQGCVTGWETTLANLTDLFVV